MGDAADLRIMTWNIRHGGTSQTDKIASRIAYHRPDILVLSEYKATESGKKLCGALAETGLRHAYHVSSPERVNSVLVATRQPAEFSEPLDQALDRPHLLIDVRVAGIALVGVYMPQGHEKTPYWRAVVAAARKRNAEPSLFIGDFNTGKHFMDETGATLVSAAFMEQMEDAGMSDLWRSRNPEAREFTWFSSAGNGFRLDHAFASPCLAQRVSQVFYSHAERIEKISDHSAMIIDIRTS